MLHAVWQPTGTALEDALEDATTLAAVGECVASYCTPTAGEAPAPAPTPLAALSPYVSCLFKNLLNRQ